MSTPKRWKPRTQTHTLTQRTQRRLLGLNSVDETAPGVPEWFENHPDVRAYVERVVGKMHRLADVYGPTEGLRRFELALDRLLIGGVQ